MKSPLDKKLGRWSTASCALALACQPSVSKKEKERFFSMIIIINQQYIHMSSKIHEESG
jgi:hypothetical protein